MLLIHTQFTWPDPLPEPIYVDGKLEYYYTYHEFLDTEDLNVRQRTHRLNVYLYKLLKDNEWEGNGTSYFSHKSLDPLPYIDPLYDLCGEDSEASNYHKRDDNRARDPEYWDVSAANNNNNFLVAFFRRDKYYADDNYDRVSRCEYGDRPFISIKILIYDPNLTLVKCVEGPCFFDNKDNKITKPLIFVQDDNVYVKVWTKPKDVNLQKASLKSLINGASRYDAWKKSHSVVMNHSNLTLLRNQVVVGITTMSANDDDLRFYLCTLTTCKEDTWVELCCIIWQFLYMSLSSVH